MSATYQNLIRPAAVALLLSAFITTSLCAEADLPAELDQALQEAGQAGDVFDPAACSVSRPSCAWPGRPSNSG